MKKAVFKLLRGQHKNSAEFAELAYPLLDQLYATALAMTRHPLDAEDLVQDTYVRAWRYYHRFEPGSSFRAWIMKILTNIFITEYNRKKRLPSRVDFDIFLSTTHDSGSGADSEVGYQVDPFADREDLFDDAVSQALNKLPEKYRTVLIMCDVNGMSYKEIACALDCPIGTVMSRLSRGRSMMARSLKGYGVQMGLV